ncbi:MAG TPA: ParB/RepB/Spo0J family partition protein [bacterium]|nr:ParB/RepB/Spo0J family partition protein [bacterium]
MSPGTDLPAADAVRLLHVPLAEIEPNPRQPRRHFTEAKIAALAQSIASQGVIQPLVVRPHPAVPGRYQLVAGERRLRAVQHLGWQEVPVLVREVPDDALLEAALVENLQREQLTPIEEAAAYRTLLDQYGYTQEALAVRVGKDRSTIANMVRLLALPLLLQEDLDDGRLTIGHARALLGVAEPDRQLGLRALVLQRGLSVRETEQLVQRERSGAPAPGAVPPADAAPPALPAAESLQFQAVQEMLERRLGTRVTIQRAGQASAGTGCIEIEYYSLDDFNRLYELLVR